MSSSDRAAAIQAVHNLFIWLNEMSATQGKMTLADIERLYTPDATMTLNNRFICSGHEGHLLHSQDLQNKMEWFRFNLPFERTIVDGDTVVGYYTCDFLSKEGVRGRAYDLCIWTLKDARISSILENVIFEGQEISVAVYD